MLGGLCPTLSLGMVFIELPIGPLFIRRYSASFHWRGEFCFALVVSSAGESLCSGALSSSVEVIGLLVDVLDDYLRHILCSDASLSICPLFEPELVRAIFSD